MEHDKLDKHYTREMKKKIRDGKKLSRKEIDTFENEFGAYKGRKDLSVVELLIANNQGKLMKFLTFSVLKLSKLSIRKNLRLITKLSANNSGI